MKTYRLRPLLLSIFLTVNTVFFAGAIYLIYVYMAKVVTEEASSNRLNMLVEINKRLTLRMREVESTAFSISTHPLFINNLSYDLTHTYSYYEARNEINRLINHYVFSRQDFNSIQVFTEQFANELNVRNQEPLVPISQFQYADYLDANVDSTWVSSHPDNYSYNKSTHVLSFVRRLVTHNRDLIGYLQVNIQESYFNPFLTDNKLYDNGKIIVIDNKGDTVFKISDPNNNNYPFPLDRRLPPSKNTYLSSGGYHNMEIEGSNYFVVYSSPNHMGWRLVEIIPYSELYRSVYLIRDILLIIGTIGTVMFIIFATLFSRKITTLISSLLDSFKQVEQGKFNIKLKRQYITEFQQLYEGYDQMAWRLKNLLESLEKENQAKNNAELNALLSQINPHFLYNTLDMILWKTQEKGAIEASEMIMKLARLFRISLSKADMFILLYEELEHGRLYSEIQKVRYPEQICYLEQVHPGHRAFYVPRFIVQPFIENAFIHGMDRLKPEQVMTIRVTTSIEDSRFIIRIANDGRNLSNSDEVGHRGSGYGIKNVRERIRLYFGTEYDVVLMQSMEDGVTVEISLPLLDSQEAVTNMKRKFEWRENGE